MNVLAVPLASCIAWSFAQSAPQPPTAPTAPVAGKDVVARVNGEELTEPAFAAWLVRAQGWHHLDEYIDLTLMRQEATRLHLPLPTAADLDAAFEQLWRDRCEMRGSEEALLDDLKRASLDKAAFRERQLGMLELETIGRRILKSRPATEAELHELFTREFGRDGVRTHVRLALFERQKGLKIGVVATRDEIAKLAAAAKQRAQEFLDQVKADPGRFEALDQATDRCLVQRADDSHVDARRGGGDVPLLRAEWFGGLVSKAVADAKAGDVVGPIETPAGYLVAAVVERTPVTYAAVEAELRSLWEQRVPPPGEVFALKEELKKQAKIEKSAPPPPSH